CIAAQAFNINCFDLNYHVFEIKQFRNHNRQINIRQTERKYYLGKERVATNRRPRFGQKGFALSDWFDEQVKLYGLKTAEKLRSQLTVKKIYVLKMILNVICLELYLNIMVSVTFKKV
ncbi:MAG: hypothetical protein IJT59_06350, partial [Desulfovibrionaceae bacterium]|nr:hypothetical protein [Desulfovibrionaceae bacterium]